MWWAPRSGPKWAQVSGDGLVMMWVMQSGTMTSVMRLGPLSLGDGLVLMWVLRSESMTLVMRWGLRWLGLL